MCKGKVFVMSAPSGTGKTTLLKQVMAVVPGLEFSVSHTTRAPRQGEVDGVDYHFVTREKFEVAIKKDLFIEWAEVHGNLYGTSRKAIADQQSKGIDVILDIDVQGAAILREQNIEGAAHLFIAPPSLKELECRLRGRGTENEEAIKTRLNNTAKEMNAAQKYDYIIVNDKVDQATEVLKAVILAERSKSKRLPSGKPILLNYTK